MEQILLIGGDATGKPFRRLPYLGYPVIFCCSDRLPENLHELTKACDIMIVCADLKIGRAIADDVWHLLKRKIVISAIPDLKLSSLRDLYPLSKVCRCELVLDGDFERCLSVVSLGESFSDSEVGSVKRLFSGLGEMLILNEPLFEESREIVRHALSSLSKLVKEFGSDELKEYLLGWVMYCLGQGSIKGYQLEALSRSS